LTLTRKQRIFIDEYLKTWNAAGSARKAGYSERSVYEIACALLVNVNVRHEIDQRLASSHMSANEVLQGIADIARGDMGEFVDANGMGFSLDMQEAKNKGLTKLIKKIKQKTVIHSAKNERDEDREVHDLEIELYDKLSALEKIGKYHGLFKDQLDLTSKGEKITVKLITDAD
jgi:phage terminase small subunit